MLFMPTPRFGMDLSLDERLDDGGAATEPEMRTCSIIKANLRLG